MSRYPLILPVLIAALILPAAALAATPPLVPPENSGANQYTETLPGAGGNEPTGTTGNKPARSPHEVLGDANAKRLEALGPDGSTTARIAAGGAPVGQGRLERGDSDSGTDAPGQVLGDITGVSDSGGMGILLPLLIAIAVLVAAAFAVRHRQTTHGVGDD